MSWDVVVFNLKRKVANVEEIDENILIDMGTGASFEGLLRKRYPGLTSNDGWISIEGSDFSMNISLAEKEGSFSNTIFFLYGEKAVYELIELCKAQGWQAFDTSLGQMLDLDHPEINGYLNHRRFVEETLNGGR
jgi:hypothetical protein